MILDIQEQLSLGQSLVAGTGDLVSTNVIDTAPAVQYQQNHDQGAGEGVWLNVRIGTAVTNGVGTLQVVLQTDDNVGFASPTEFALTGALLAAALPANTFIARVRLPIGMERFYRVVYRSATAAVTVGTVDAFITKDTQFNRSYQAAFTVQ